MLVVGKEEGSGQGRCAQDFLLHRYVKEDGINRSPSALFVTVYAFPGKCFVRDTNKLQPQRVLKLFFTTMAPSLSVTSSTLAFLIVYLTTKYPCFLSLKAEYYQSLCHYWKIFISWTSQARGLRERLVSSENLKCFPGRWSTRTGQSDVRAQRKEARGGAWEEICHPVVVLALWRSCL